MWVVGWRVIFGSDGEYDGEVDDGAVEGDFDGDKVGFFDGRKVGSGEGEAVFGAKGVVVG